MAEAMTPAEYIRPKEFIVVESTRWPPDSDNRFAQWFRHRDGRIVFYIRGTVRAGTYQGDLGDIERREAFGTSDVCHFCVCCIGFGRVDGAGLYTPRFGTTGTPYTESPWRTLCQPCRLSLAAECRANYLKRLRDLGVEEPA